MSANVTFSLAQFQAGYCWQGVQQYANDLVSLLTGTVPSVGKVLVSSNAPAPADRDGIWVRAVGGYLEGIYLYSGGWFRPNPIAPSSSERRLWEGTEADVWAYDGGDGTNPSVTPPTITTGAMWQVDHNYDFKFPIGPGTNGTTYDGQPATIIGQGSTGGAEKVALALKEIPSHTHTVPLYQGDSVNHADRINTCDEVTPQNLSYQSGATGGDTGDLHTWSHPNMVPYRGVFFIQRTIRQMIQAV